MKNIFYNVFLCLLTNCLLVVNIYAQTDTVLTSSLKNARLNYIQQIGLQSRLFNGVKYPEYKQAHSGDAYYLSSGFQNAYLRYDGADFYNVPILFDIYKDVVVIVHPSDASCISLLKPKLDKFTIAGHSFVRIDADSTQKTLKPGFYELLYAGNSQLLAKHSKDLQEEKYQTTFRGVFNEHVAYYLRKGDNYHEVSSKGPMLAVFKDHKKELDSYIKLNKLNFSDNKEQSMIKVAAYYDQLNK